MVAILSSIVLTVREILESISEIVAQDPLPAWSYAKPKPPNSGNSKATPNVPTNPKDGKDVGVSLDTQYEASYHVSQSKIICISAPIPTKPDTSNNMNQADPSNPGPNRTSPTHRSPSTSFFIEAFDSQQKVCALIMQCFKQNVVR